MCELHNMVNLPWVILGDFNETLVGAEKEGGNLRPQRCMHGFCDALQDCNLEDLGFIGERFTWSRGRMRERLNRVVANPEWCAKFPMDALIHEDFSKSDHRPILLDCSYMESPQVTR